MLKNVSLLSKNCVLSIQLKRVLYLKVSLLIEIVIIFTHYTVI